MSTEHLILPRIIGHRGACGYAPENTLVSIRKAHAIGLKWVEFDVMLTRDEQLVIFHDDTLERTTNGFGKLRESSSKYLKSLDAGSWFGLEFTGEKIPTLKEAVECCDKLGLGMNIEIKVSNKEAKDLARKVYFDLGQYSLGSTSLLLSSFSIEALQTLKDHGCSFPLALNLDNWREDWQCYADKLSLYSLHYAVKELNAARVNLVKNTGRHVLAYTINNAKEAEALFAMGVDAVFSDVGDQIRLE